VELTAGQQLAVFRIVQECLTNVLKRGGRGTAARLHLDWSGPGLTLHVASGTAAVAEGAAEAAPADRVWQGIPGMRERALGLPTRLQLVAFAHERRLLG
jgi:signal transduction histidine kinase